MFTSHLLMSPENQLKIRQADEGARKKEQHIIEKQKLIKNLIAEDKKKKKITCRADKIKARELPSRPGRGRGRSRGRGGPPKL